MDTYTAPDGRIWKRVGEEPYTRKDGLPTTLRLWESTCVKCGAPIHVKTTLGADPAKSNSFQSKHCDEHKDPYRVALGKLGHRKRSTP